METNNENDSKTIDIGKVYIMDMGTVSKKKVNALKNGEGELLGEVIDSLQIEQLHSEDKVKIVPVIMIYEKEAFKMFSNLL